MSHHEIVEHPNFEDVKKEKEALYKSGGGAIKVNLEEHLQQ